MHWVVVKLADPNKEQNLLYHPGICALKKLVVVEKIGFKHVAQNKLQHAQFMFNTLDTTPVTLLPLG
jgi:hypothetical protein